MKNKAGKWHDHKPQKKMQKWRIEFRDEAHVPVMRKHIRVPPNSEHTRIIKRICDSINKLL